jgi:hypothetical protein
MLIAPAGLPVLTSPFILNNKNRGGVSMKKEKGIPADKSGSLPPSATPSVFVKSGSTPRILIVCQPKETKEPKMKQ